MTGPMVDIASSSLELAFALLYANGKFVESPTRANQPAVEVVIGNPGAISGGTGLSLSDINTYYQEANSVVSGITTTVLSHTFAGLGANKVYSLSASGTNIATYELLINSVLVEKKRTSFGSALDVKFDFYPNLKALVGSVLQLKVTHNRISTGDFNATLKYSEGT